MPNLSSLVNPASAVITNSVEQPVPTNITDASVALEEISFYLGKLVKMSEALAVVDTAQRQRVAVEAIPTVTVNGNNTPFRPVDNNNTPVYQVGANAFGNTYAVVPEIWRTIELARQNFQTSIRSNLQFS